VADAVEQRPRYHFQPPANWMNDRGVPTLIYTGIRGHRPYQETQCLATSRDDVRTWQKDSRNPVIGVPPVGLAVTGATPMRALWGHVCR
jgi:sucrose-6-phosphate hydrolase SacC (GH32 family)